jgi:flagella basal body P-ring formation protein FlgA
MNPRNPFSLGLVQGLLLAAAALLCGPLGAGYAAAAAPTDALKLYLEQATTGLPGRVEITVGDLSERLKLAPCAHVEPYIPASSRLWGKTQIGLKCTEGSTAWNVYLPIEIKVYGQALVAARALRYGQPLSADDVRLQDVEFTSEPAGSTIADPRKLEGKIVARMVPAGQILRQEYFHAPAVIGAGDSVQVVYNGPGFNISTNGRSLGSAADGQPVRVQVDDGRIVQGTARAGRIVEMRL